MATIRFHKMVASGNDFIVIDNRRRLIGDARRAALRLCAWHTGIGADGILLLEKSTRAAFKMRIVNSDGSEAEACGNGFRCIALYAKKMLRLPASFKFESLSGIIDAHVSSTGTVRVRLIEPHSLRLKGRLKAAGRTFDFGFINTGVPHAVIFENKLADLDVSRYGKAVREHVEFKPKGTNVNFIKVRSRHALDVRTYERGVEAETLACGTGSTASALISALRGYTQAPVVVRTSGGELLKIDFELKQGQPTQVTLEGKAQFVFEGTVSL